LVLRITGLKMKDHPSWRVVLQLPSQMVLRLSTKTWLHPLLAEVKSGICLAVSLWHLRETTPSSLLQREPSTMEMRPLPGWRWWLLTASNLGASVLCWTFTKVWIRSVACTSHLYIVNVLCSSGNVLYCTLKNKQTVWS